VGRAPRRDPRAREDVDAFADAAVGSVHGRGGAAAAGNDDEHDDDCSVAEDGMTTTKFSRGWLSADRVVAVAVLLHGWSILQGFALFTMVDRGEMRLGAVGLVVGLVVGLGVGAAAALGQVRGWVFGAAALLACWGVGFFVAIVDAPPVLQQFLNLADGGFLLGMFGGFGLLAPRLDLLSLGLPLALHVAAAVQWWNSGGALAAWRQDRLAVWDVPSAVFLIVGIVFFVLTLAAREAVARARWQQRPLRIDVAASGATHGGRLVGLAVVLALAAVAIVPFLLQTRVVTPSPEGTLQLSPSSSSSTPPPTPPRWRAPDLGALERLLVRMVTVAMDVAEGVVVVAGVGVGVVVLLLPLERRRRLRALSSPDPSLPPTERVRRRFQRALVALQEAGVVVDGAIVAPRGLFDRVHDVDDGARVPGLEAAVSLWEEVRFGGRGLPARAEETMAAAMDDVVAWAHARRTAWQAFTSSFALPAR
jgi:hypothetical protein